MDWISQLFRKKSAVMEVDIVRTCLALRKRWHEIGSAPGKCEKKKLGLKVSLPLQEALIDTKDFCRICNEYLEAGWRLDFAESEEKGMVEFVVEYQPTHVHE